MNKRMKTEKLPDSVHDNYGGQHRSDSATPGQLKRDAEETKEQLQMQLKKAPSAKKSRK